VGKLHAAGVLDDVTGGADERARVLIRLRREGEKRRNERE
jgi:hypothetical protein